MLILQVANKRQYQLFYDFHIRLYSDDPNFICPLRKDLKSILEKRDKRHQTALFIAMEEQEVVGRIAAFYPVDLNKGGIGFFECVQQKEVAFALFETAIGWLNSQGFDECIGPVNFGQRDQYWGLLVDAHSPPLFQENYHKPYYAKYFEDYGFQLSYKQFTFLIELEHLDLDRLKRLYERSISNGATYQTLNRKLLEKQATDLAYVYNEAWKHQDFFKPLDKTDLIKSFKAMRHVMDDQLITLAYLNGEPAGIFASIPEINPYLKNAHGKMNWIRQVKLILKLRLNPPKSAKGLIFGIIPTARNKGMDASLILNTFQNIKEHSKYNRFYLSWVGDFNVGMLKMMDQIGARVDKVHHTYKFRKK
jgi:hypothetical protein